MKRKYSPEMEAIIAADPDLPKSDAWKPIKTAPTDGTEVLVIATRHNMLVAEPKRHVAVYQRGWWSGRDVLSHVTHWMPLAPLPESIKRMLVP